MCEGFASVDSESMMVLHLSFAQVKAFFHCGDPHHSTDDVPTIRVAWIDLALLMVEDAVKVGGAGEHEGHPDEDEHQHPDPAVATQCEWTRWLDSMLSDR